MEEFIFINEYISSTVFNLLPFLAKKMISNEYRWYINAFS
jgi:hypothetical protein